MAFVNRNFAQVLNDGAAIDYAPVVFAPNPHPPTEEEYNERGYYRVNIQPPNPPEGKIVSSKRFAVVNNECVAVYEYIDAPPPPPRRWTRLSLKTALATASMLSAAKEFLLATEIAPGYSAWEALSDCDYVEEGYPDSMRWNAILDGAATALGKTRAEVDAFLDAVPTEDSAE